MSASGNPKTRRWCKTRGRSRTRHRAYCAPRAVDPTVVPWPLFLSPRAELRDGHRFRVAVLLPETPLQALVGVALRQAGAVPIAYDQATLGKVANTRIAAGVVELPRALTTDLARLQETATRLPHMPILVYSAGSMTGVPDLLAGDPATRRFRFASPSSAETTIREDVEWLLRAIPACAVTWLVTFLVRDIPLVGRGYIAEFLWRLDVDRAERKRDVTSAAAALGTKRSALEHLLKQKTPLPPPKELAEWLTLLLVTYAARGLGLSAHQVSADLGLDRHRLGRLHARLLRAYSAFPLLPACTQFDLALVAFAERCGVARNRVVKVLRMVR